MRAEVLVVPGLPTVDVVNPPWTSEFLRTRMLPHASAAPEPGPIYLSRGASANNRMVENEQQILDEVLLPRGFRVLNPAGLSVADQIALFGAATAIVTPHGAGMTNVLFDTDGDPLETENLAGSTREKEAVDLLRAALEDADAPKEQFERLGIS